MPHKDPETRRAYARKYWREHPELLARANSPEASKRRKAYMKRKYAEPGFRLRFKHRSWKRLYNLTPEDVSKMLRKQRNKCAVCKADISEKFAIDHDHACCGDKGRSCGKCVRGLLCTSCNAGIGLLQDSVKVLKNAIAYIVRGKEVCQKRHL
jgi:hypothetical protein